MKTFHTTVYVRGVEIEVEYEAVYEPARLSGPPENCNPEWSECNVLSMKYSDNQQSIDPVSEKEVEDACWEHFMGMCEEPDEPDNYPED